MFAGLWNLSVRTYIVLQRYAPTNRLINHLRTRTGLRWGVPAMLLAVPYMAVAVGCVLLIEHGWTEWLYLPFLLCFYNALKFVIFGPISLALLTRARLREHRTRRTQDAQCVHR